ncbi:hypothetical protein N657DRAFT_372866 [Parathielavia appendiculata]|uniref:Uncharacterized protein n=1 Tax=Parathielavia appendiculata TaxID=2587402 RepID=A0AAN6YYL9_9PEZI|nr:hypothetical protein N657DRAFT_372866 [Parathielavia appendiculata]
MAMLRTDMRYDRLGRHCAAMLAANRDPERGQWFENLVERCHGSPLAPPRPLLSGYFLFLYIVDVRPGWWLVGLQPDCVNKNFDVVNCLFSITPASLVATLGTPWPRYAESVAQVVVEKIVSRGSIQEVAP